MPSVSDKQKVAMAIACHDPDKSTSGIPQDVACEFNRADAAKHKRAKRKVKEAVEYLETLKMIEDVRNMSFTSFLVESRNEAPDALSLIAQIDNEAQQAVDAKLPGALAFWQRVQRALKELKPEHRLMGAIRARDAFNAVREGLTQEDADLLIEATTYNVPSDASFSDVEKMYNAAKRAMSLADKLKNPESRKKHKSRVHGNFNKLKARYEKMKRAQGSIKEALNKTDAGDIIEEKKKPSAGLTKKQKSATVKKARAGKDVFGGGFKKVERKAKAGGADDPEAVAASAMWKKKAKLAKARESVEFATAEVDFIVESAFEYQKMMKKLNKVFEKYLDPADYDNKDAIIKVAMEHAAEKIDGFDVMTENEKMDLIVETCAKYDLIEAFGDHDEDAPDPDADDPERFTPGMEPDDQQIGAPQTSASKSAFKLEPTDIGRLAEIIAKYSDFPPENPGLAAAVDKLQYADLFHLTPQEVVTARRLLAHLANEAGA